MDAITVHVVYGIATATTYTDDLYYAITFFFLAEVEDCRFVIIVSHINYVLCVCCLELWVYSSSSVTFLRKFLMPLNIL